MLSLPVAKLPEGRAWSYELKFDGYRSARLEEQPAEFNCSPATAKNFSRRFYIDRDRRWKSFLTKPSSTVRSSLTIRKAGHHLTSCRTTAAVPRYASISSIY